MAALQNGAFPRLSELDLRGDNPELNDLLFLALADGITLREGLASLRVEGTGVGDKAVERLVKVTREAGIVVAPGLRVLGLPSRVSPSRREELERAKAEAGKEGVEIVYG